ncbi:MFS transporter [Methanolobus sp. ZRKC3]|uniref:MFS transporter n=1 Tax=Methanolobus sp. ZRKC3 TaxID=3125786 RepID=UPI00324F3AC0
MRLNSIQFLISSSFMLSYVFIPIFAESLGASYLEVGFIVACYGAASLLSSFIFGKVADIHRLRPIVLVGMLFAALVFYLQTFAYDALSLALLRGLAGFSVGIYPAALTIYVHYQGRSVGKFISFGSLGWMLGFLLAGVIGDIKYLFMLSSLFFCIAFFAAFGLKDIEKPSVKVSYFSLDTLRKNFATYMSIFVRHTGAVAVWTILPLYLVRLGASSFWIGVIYAINPFVQFIIMQRLDDFKNEWLVRWGFIMSALAFTSYYLAPSFVFIIPGMVLVALGWSFLFVGATRLLIERNLEKATATGILNSTISAGSILGAGMGGFLLHSYGFRETMFFAIICMVLGAAIFRMMDRFVANV